ncbi:MAG: HAD-IIB family hydrolase, partial [Deltaproteobacteria bacterium]|nr:HAD-IIB family hydrolase [Deltaproteobacteria bacterium]
MKKTIIFTDLDGTLIDHDTYRFDQVEETLKRLKEGAVPVIICSSKTRAEIEAYRTSMGLDDPFIAENGGAIFVPQATFDSKAEGFVKKRSYLVMELGKPYDVLRNAWTRMKAKEGFHMTGFSEMTIEQIVQHTSLPVADARLAAMREYSEPFLFFENHERLRSLKKLLREQGLQITKGGRFYHLTGNNDKGKAVEILRKL